MKHSELHEKLKSFTFAKENSCKSTIKIETKVRDCCHDTCKYKGLVHSVCNLRHNISIEIPSFFTMNQTTIINLSLKNWQTILKENLII